MKKVVVITGASSGIGEASAKMLAKDYQLVLAARSEAKLQSTVEEIKKLGGEAQYKVTDVSQNDQVEALAKFALDTYGQIDVWINNAGIMPQAWMKEKKVKEWDAMIDVNIKGTLYGIGAALPTMREKKSGQIINIASDLAFSVHPGGVVYSATKYATRAISEGLRQEVAADRDNIRVTAIYPGVVDTNIINTISDVAMKQQVEKFKEAVGAIAPERVALAIKNAIEMPEDTGLNDIVLRSINQA
ncbi:putative oxidoreductase [Mesoplasma sp. JKS002660]|uniref:SDR family oxidoreductase n=1 Tax=Mesoplasma whartonense TaxID=2878854 RepID=UPI002022AAE8|nr:SDR family oxidoreductase [Mesoplasma sp. JKS002660]MCL8213103.1 putative oxidoreductase [Mesoplasma sp. JKS002660]